MRKIKSGSLVVWGLVAKEVHAEVLSDFTAHELGVVVEGWQVAKLWHTGLLVLVRAAGEASRWGERVVRVEVSEVETVVVDGALWGALGDSVSARNAVCGSEAVEELS